MEVDAELPIDHYGKAERALAKGEEDRAGTELKLALQANPLDAKAHYLLGALLAKQGIEDQAMVGFQRSITIDPTQPEALHNLGTILIRRGEAIPAIELLEAAISFSPEYIPAYNSLAKAYFIAGLPELAMSAYKEVLTLDADNPIASRNLELLVTASGAVTDSPTSGTEETKDGAGPEDEGSKPSENEEKPDKPKPAATANDPAPKTKLPSIAVFKSLLTDLPYLKVEDHAGMLTLTGWTRGKEERAILERILNKWPEVLDLTCTDTGDPQRMLEVDVTMFVVTDQNTHSVGFNFLRQVNVSATYFSGKNLEGSEWKGLEPAIIDLPNWGSLFTASIDYDVNIANASENLVSVLARPHLTTLSGTPASFLAGGEFVFRVSGIESGDIKPYPFGTSVTVTPTLLRTPGEDGAPRIHLAVKAERTSVLEYLSAQTDEDSIVFDKLSVDSQAVLELEQTLILSGLNQRETLSTRSGVPILRSIPFVKYLFSQKTTVENNTAILILLTPRDPAFQGEQTRRARADFVRLRREYTMAKDGTKQDMLEFQRRHPNWRDLAPNRFASHFFMLETSDLYRRVSAEDFVDENLDLHVLQEAPKEKPKKEEDNKEEVQ